MRFGPKGISLEELILRRALGMELDSQQREQSAGGVMMIPIPGRGILEKIDGLTEARAVRGIEEIDITIRPGHRVVPLPEGSSYLGFIFARGETPAEVEDALRASYRCLHFTLKPELSLSRSS